MTYATSSDVAVRLGRELTTEESSLVEIRLDDIERRIKRRIPDLAEKITAGDVDEADVVQVEADVVLRLVRNRTGICLRQTATTPTCFGRISPTGSWRSWPQSGRRSVS